MRCVSECVDTKLLPKESSALDLGCAVGRSSFELSKYCQYVKGIDNSQSFITAAEALQQHGEIEYFLIEEGTHQTRHLARLPKDIHAERVEFICHDATKIPRDRVYHIVLVANLICRLNNPKEFLEHIHEMVIPSGQLIITSPYSWLEEFTPSSNWFKEKKGLESLKEILGKHFNLKKTFDMPFLMREHLRKYQWGVAEVSIWIKK